MNPLREDLLRKILCQPSAPFQEKHVVKTATEILRKAKVPHFLDPVGNIVVGVASQKDYLKLIRQKSKEPIRFFMAHMDHPGFHGVEWRSGSELGFKWHGGSPLEHLQGAKVWLANEEGWITHGEIEAFKMIPSGRALDSGQIRFTGDKDWASAYPKAKHLYGGFAFREPCWREGDIMYTKAADDLVGAFAIIDLALDLYKKKKRNLPFLGLLTRAEEVGFVGAIAHFQLGWIQKAKRKVICVSLETSRTLPGAEIGRGPVVRLGDKYTVFDPGALRVFSALAAKKMKNPHQRRVMDGGTCEATAAMTFGIPSIGISVPLGNYHNQSFEGGPDSRGMNGPAPEFVHVGDVEGLLELCHLLLEPKLPWEDPWSDKMKDLRQYVKDYANLLKL